LLGALLAIAVSLPTPNAASTRSFDVRTYTRAVIPLFTVSTALPAGLLTQGEEEEEEEEEDLITERGKWLGVLAT